MNKKIIFKIAILILTFFMSYKISFAAGCCIKDVKVNSASNCTDVANAAACSGGTFMNYSQCSSLAYCSNPPAAIVDPNYKNCYCLSSQQMAIRSVIISMTNETSEDACVKKCAGISYSTGTVSVPILYYSYNTSGAHNDIPKSMPSAATTTPASTPAATVTAPSPTATPSGGVVNFTNPLQFNNVEDFLSGILSAVQKIIVVLALVFIVLGAVFILTSAGNPAMVEQGKKSITMAIVGLAIGIAAPSILKELAGILGWGGATNAAVSGAMTLSQIAVRVLDFLLGIAGVLTLIMLVIGAIMYLTSAGDEDRIESGKKIFKFSLIGIVIVMASMIIVQQLAMFFVAPNAVTTTTITTTDVCVAAGGAGEVCTTMDPDPARPGQYTSPVGKDCYWRNVCPSTPAMQACCK